MCAIHLFGKYNMLQIGRLFYLLCHVTIKIALLLTESDNTTFRFQVSTIVGRKYSNVLYTI